MPNIIDQIIATAQAPASRRTAEYCATIDAHLAGLPDDTARLARVLRRRDFAKSRERPMTDPIFFLEIDFGKLGREWQGQNEWTRQNVIDFVVSGELGRVTRVLEFHDGGRDITEDIAREIADARYADREPVSYAVQSFLHDQLGVTSTRGLNLEAA